MKPLYDQVKLNKIYQSQSTISDMIYCENENAEVELQYMIDLVNDNYKLTIECI